MENTRSVEVTYKFFLPEHDEDYRTYCKAFTMHGILGDIDERCRKVLKYEMMASEDRRDLAEEIRSMIREERILDG